VSTFINCLLKYYCTKFIKGALNYTLRTIAETEMNMTSTERVLHYSSEIPQEGPFLMPESEPPPDWPAQGIPLPVVPANFSFSNAVLQQQRGD